MADIITSKNKDERAKIKASAYQSWCLLLYAAGYIRSFFTGLGPVSILLLVVGRIKAVIVKTNDDNSFSILHPEVGQFELLMALLLMLANAIKSHFEIVNLWQVILQYINETK